MTATITTTTSRTSKMTTEKIVKGPKKKLKIVDDRKSLNYEKIIPKNVHLL